MSEGERSRVGIRELRQNLSVYVDRVKAGETLEVTEHGRPVARLAPLAPAGATGYDRLVAEGAVRRGSGRWSDLGPPLPSSSAARSVLDVLLELRDEDTR
jgi:prevent-host-death family protein